MKRAEDCFCFLYFELVNREPKGGDAAILQPALHQGKKLLCIEIDRTGHFWRGRLSRYNIILSRAGLEEEAPILNKGGDAGIVQRIGMVGPGIKASQIEYLPRDIDDIHPLEVGLSNEGICSRTTAVADEQHVFGVGQESQRKVCK